MQLGTFRGRTFTQFLPMRLNGRPIQLGDLAKGKLKAFDAPVCFAYFQQSLG